jgi:large subunit ribosomal protein L29
MIDLAELRELTTDELQARVRDLEDQVFRMRIQKSMGQLDVPLKLRFTRRDLARVRTVLGEKQRQSLRKGQ